MTSATFDFAPLLPAGLPAPAVKWTGLAKYSFVGGNNDPDQVPVDGLIDAVNAVLRREGKTLATYGLDSGPQGYRPLREFLTTKLKRDAGIDCAADDILIVSGSLQALDLVNATLLARGDTVIIEQDTYQGALNRLTRLGVNVVGIPLDQDGMRLDKLAVALSDLKYRGITPKYIYTIPTVQNPTGTIMPEARRVELLELSQQYGVPIFEDDCYADLIWDGKRRPPAIYAMAGNGGVIRPQKMRQLEDGSSHGLQSHQHGFSDLGRSRGRPRQGEGFRRTRLDLPSLREIRARLRRARCHCPGVARLLLRLVTPPGIDP